MATFRMALALGEDPRFDQRVAAVVRFAEMRFSEGLTPGEVQLELLSGPTYDEQVIMSAEPVLEAIADHRNAQAGYRHWLKTRPLAALPSLGSYAAEIVAGVLGLGAVSYLVFRYGLTFLEYQEIGANLVALVLAPLFAFLISYTAYLLDRVSCARRVRRFRRLLAGRGGAAGPGSETLSLRA